MADITISIETKGMTKDINELMKDISGVEGVRRQEILSRE
jgi:ACT domain-containing protein